MKRLKDYLPRFRNKTHRQLLSLTLAMDPSMRKELQSFIRMGVRDIRPDYMLVLNKVTNKYDYMDDPSCWNATLDLPSGIMLVVLLRSHDGYWFITGG